MHLLGSSSQLLRCSSAVSFLRPPATSSTASCDQAGRMPVASYGRSWRTISCSSSPFCCALRPSVPSDYPVFLSTRRCWCIVALWRSTISLSTRQRECGGTCCSTNRSLVRQTCPYQAAKKPSRKKADSHRLTCDERDLSRNRCLKLRGRSQICDTLSSMRRCEYG